MSPKFGLSVVLTAALLGGCSQQSPSSSASTSDTTAAGVSQEAHANTTDDGRNASVPSIEYQKLDAATLARILDVHIWEFKFSGGPVRCWVEIEEVGQETMPRRFPEDEGIRSSDNEGEILFAWRRTPSRGGALILECGGHHRMSGLDSNAFLFGWKGMQSSGDFPVGRAWSVNPKAREEVVLMRYNARELRFGDAEPREVTLTLKAILGEPKGDGEASVPETDSEREQG